MRWAATRPGHVGPADGAKAAYQPVEDKLEQVSISGNSVSLEDRMIKVSRTAMDYQRPVDLYRKHLSIIKTALGRPGG